MAIGKKAFSEAATFSSQVLQRKDFEETVYRVQWRKTQQSTQSQNDVLIIAWMFEWGLEEVDSTQSRNSFKLNK